MKEKWYSRPHDQFTAFNIGLEDAQNSTIVPIAFYDEGLGSPGSYNANPKHASFSETDVQTVTQIAESTTSTPK